LNTIERMASPLVFTYNESSKLLVNYFEDASGSSLPGVSGATLFTLQSPNLFIKGVTLTLQFYNNVVTPAPDANTSLQCGNVTIIASSGTNTLGTLSYSRQYQNPVAGKDPLLNKIRVSKVSSYVTLASGIFANYLFGNVITVSNATTGVRTISIYSSE